MDPELKREMNEIRILIKDNNRMLHAIRRGQWFGFFGKILLWTVIIVLPFLLYQHFLEPLLSQFSPNALGPQGLLGVSSSEEVKKLIDSYLSGQ
jgi:hypothetical protein